MALPRLHGRAWPAAITVIGRVLPGVSGKSLCLGVRGRLGFFRFDERLPGSPLLIADLSGAEGTILDAVPLRFNSLHLCEAAIHK